MLQREYVCKNLACPGYQNVPTMTADESLHCKCGGLLELAIYPLSTVWVGAITSKYLDRSKEGGQAMDGSHVVYEKSDKPGKAGKATRISTWQEQKEYCKRNGLARPQDFPANFEVADDGKTALNTRGLPGTEL